MRYLIKDVLLLRARKRRKKAQHPAGIEPRVLLHKPVFYYCDTTAVLLKVILVLIDIFEKLDCT